VKTPHTLHVIVAVVSVFLFTMLGNAVELGGARAVKIITVLDNYVVGPGLNARWGLAVAVVSPTGTTLFDSGPSGEALLANMKQLGLEPSQFRNVVISHDHGDHTRGLRVFLRVNPDAMVFLPGRAAAATRYVKAAGAKYRNVHGPIEVATGIRSTGPMDKSSHEQALIIDTEDGLVVITGCAHPGIVTVLKRVRSLNPGKRLALVMGGFHLYESSTEQIDAIIQDFRRMKVGKVSPSHCSGDYARKRFKEVYGPDYVEGGAGLVLLFTLAH
jgi:7,8-dihydropterin-6-yl-methyl-4-(beta-D-ribofuranosyl)aminobenzene 5'-phosphate synthase